MSKAIDDISRQLINDIFADTGMVVDVDDPLIICALVTSRHIRQAQESASKELAIASNLSVQAINEAAAAAVNSLNQAVEVISHRAIKKADESVRESAAGIAKSEMVRVRVQLDQLIESARSKFSMNVIKDDLMPSRTRIAAGVAVVAMCAGIVGALCFGGNQGMSRDQRQAVNVGREIIRIYPQLDTATQEKLQKAIASQKQ